MPTRPPRSWSDLAGCRVGLWGLGKEGSANFRRLAAMKTVPVLVDDRPSGPFEGHRVLATDDGGLDALLACQVVVKTPGVSRHRPEVNQLESAGVEVVGGLGLWFEEVEPTSVVAITGTKGKSTTAALTGHLLEGLGRRALVVGNIGQVPYDPELAENPELWVLEVSSFQATDLRSAPPVVAVTSLSPDHLDWHGTVSAYFEEKLSICTLPGAQLTIADGDSELLAQHRRLLGPEVRWVSSHESGLDGPWVDDLGLLGEHNRRNALLARAVLIALGVKGADDDRALQRAAAGFDGLESRLRALGDVGGVTFVDDSLSTNVLPTVAALAAFPGRRVAVLVGGFDRGIDYEPLAAAVTARPEETFVLTLPDNGPRIHQTLTAAFARTASPVQTSEHDTLESATAAAYRWARPDGVVLLSPAAPSFGRYRDYEARAEAFAQAMQRCALGDVAS
jgi:UDP-N-acetylmuramoyl-L-alanine---L-glutamate ligase